jgi:ElaB/YqjD/DUF883 family membrane-anchored ribosome-binding protein
MEATRNDLSDKIEKLEKQVVDTVQEATSTVADAVQGAKDMVESVKDTVAGTMESVNDTVDAVKGAAENAVEGVKDTLQGAADSVRDTFDLPRQVDRHPWMMMGGAVAVGFVAGKLFGHAPEARRALSRAAESGGRFAATTASVAGTAASAAGGLLGTVEKMFGPEINKLKELAIGALVGAIRDVAVQAAPEPMARQVGDIFDSFTSKLGGRPVEGAVMSPRPSEEETVDGPRRRF